jgi:hypothetical protein
MRLKFIYPKDHVTLDTDANREALCEAICNRLSTVLTLPDEIMIEIVKMSPSAYAETYLHYKNNHRIRLNNSLQINDILIPLVHELIHLEQLTTGKLMINHEGLYIWDKIPYNVNMNNLHYGDYLQLPWELDVHNRLPRLLETFLKPHL